jgi:ABC-2 type transport system permease protein
MQVLELILVFLKRNFKLSLTVTVIMTLIILLLVIIFPDMQIDDASAVSESWPEIMKDLFGDPVYSFTNIYGWLYLQIFHITYWLAFGILGSILAAGIAAKEAEENTIDILLSCPVTRTVLIVSRIISVIVIFMIITVIMIFNCIIGISAAGYTVYFGLVMQAVTAGFFISLVFVSVTLFISIYTFRQTLSVFFTLGIMGFLFIYEEVLAKLYPFLDNFSFLNPFRYYKPENILIYNSFSVSDFIMLIVFFLLILILSILYFIRKEIII